jgi:hypothetical protein
MELRGRERMRQEEKGWGRKRKDEAGRERMRQEHGYLVHVTWFLSCTSEVFCVLNICGAVKISTWPCAISTHPKVTLTYTEVPHEAPLERTR